MSIVSAKWISSIILFIATIAVSVLPVIVFNYFMRRKRFKNAISMQKTSSMSTNNDNRPNHSRSSNVLTLPDDNEFVNEGRCSRSDSIKSVSSISSKKLNAKSAAILQMFMFFGGGVLLATCFCHLIPEVKENFEKYLILKEANHTDDFHNQNDHNSLYSNEDSIEVTTDFKNLDLTILPKILSNLNQTEKNLTYLSSNIENDEEENHSDHDHEHQNHGHTHNHDIPFVEIAICCGFFLIFLLEEIVHTFLHKHQHSLKDSQKFQSDSINDIRWDLPYQSKTDQDTHLVNGKNKNIPCYDNYAVDYQSESQFYKDDKYFNPNISNQSSSLNRSCITIKSDQPLKSEENLLPASVRFIQGLVTIGAFSAHSIFDGLAIGLQSTENQIYTMLFAISMHKLVVAFAVGLELFDQTSSLWMTTVHMSIFSIMSPIGIWIVIFSQSGEVTSENESLVLIMLSAVATGTIIYIVFFEILQKDRSSSPVNGLLLWLIMVIGFVLMLSINIFVVH